MSDGRVHTKACGHDPEGRPLHAFTLVNGPLQAKVMDWGATLQSLRVPDRHGRVGEVLLGFDQAAGWLQPRQPYLGATVGRVANRIAKASFTLDGRQHRLNANDGAHALHGGERGFHRQPWHGETLLSEQGPGVLFSRSSADGEEGYPGRLDVQVLYVLAADALHIEWSATTDRRTPINLTQHAYFNLEADGGDVLGHRLQIHASRFTPLGAGLIPTGELSPVAGTPFDFCKLHEVGERLREDAEQLRLAGGYDHNWVLDGPPDRHQPGLRLAAVLQAPRSGRRMTLSTSHPGLQVYSGNFLDGSLPGRGGLALKRHAGLCLEPQHFPDSVHQPGFPSIWLDPGERYLQRAVYRFDIV